MLATAFLSTLLAAPALVFGAPTFITDPGSSGILIKPSSSLNTVSGTCLLRRPTKGKLNLVLHPDCPHQCMTVVPGAGGIVGNGNPVVPAACSVNSPSYLQGWEIQRGSGQVRLKNSNYCLDAGLSMSAGSLDMLAAA